MWRHLCDNFEPLKRIEYPYYGVPGHRVPASDTLVWHVGFPKAEAEYNKTIVAFGFVVLFNRGRSLVIVLSLSIDRWPRKKSDYPLVA